MNQKAPKRRYSEGKEIVEDDCDSLTSENAVHPTLLLSNPPQSSWTSPIVAAMPKKAIAAIN